MPTEAFDHLPAKCQADAATAVFASIQAVKHSKDRLRKLRIDADTIVSDRKLPFTALRNGFLQIKQGCIQNFITVNSSALVFPTFAGLPIFPHGLEQRFHSFSAFNGVGDIFIRFSSSRPLYSLNRSWVKLVTIRRGS
jgi:hypothetical protein